MVPHVKTTLEGFEADSPSAPTPHQGDTVNHVQLWLFSSMPFVKSDGPNQQTVRVGLTPKFFEGLGCIPLATSITAAVCLGLAVNGGLNVVSRSRY